MSKLTDEDKYKIISDLASGITPTEISAARDYPYASILRIKREFETAKANNTLDQLINMPEMLRNQLMQQVKDSTPVGLQSTVETSLASVAKQLNMADALSETLMATANKLSERIGVLIMRVETPSELSVLAESLSVLQNAFFNKNLTQVNIQNNHGGEETSKYREFLGD